MQTQSTLFPVLLSLLIPITSWSAEPTGSPTPRDAQRQQRIAERDRLWQQARDLKAAGKFAEAIAAGEKTLALEQQIVGPVHAELTVTLKWLADCWEQREDFASAVKARKAILQISTQVYGEQPWKVTDARLALAHTQTLSHLTSADRQRLAAASEKNSQVVRLYAAFKYREALTLANEVLLIRTELLGNEHPDTATSIGNLGVVYGVQGEYAKAEALCVRSLSIMEKLLGAEHADTAISLNVLATLYYKQSEYAKAEPLYLRSLAIREKVLGAEHPDTAASLNNLALFYQTQAQYAKAEPLYVRSLEILEKVLGAEHPDTATSLKNLAELYRKQGEYAKAEPLYVRSLEIKEKVLGAEHLGTATSLTALALFYTGQGEYAKAEPLYVRSLEIMEKVLGAEHPDTATCLNNLAAFYQARAEYAKAEPLFVRSLEIKEKVFGAEHPDTATSLNNLALVYQARAEYAKAEPLAVRSLGVMEKVLGAEHPDTATSLNNLALVYQAKAEYAKAEPLYVRSLAIREKVLGAEHPDTATSLHNLAALYWAQTEYAKGEPLNDRALRIQLKNLELAAAIQSERQQLAMTLQNRHVLDSRLHNFAKGGGSAASAYSHVLAWKGCVSARQLAMRAVADRVELRPLLDDLQRVSRDLARYAFASPKPAERDAWQQRVRSLSTQKDRLEAELSAKSSKYRSAKRQATWEDLRSSLPGNSRLVDFVEITMNGKRHLLAFVVSPKSPPVLVDMGDAGTMALAIECWRSDSGRSSIAEAGNPLSADSPEGSPTRVAIQELLGDGADPAFSEPTGQLLRKRLWEPLVPHLGGATLVLISPDGPLGRLPLGALPGQKPGTYLLEDVSIAVVPMPYLLPQLLAAPDSPPKPAGNLLLVGGVDYDRRATMLAQAEAAPAFGRSAARDSKAPFKPLPNTLGELAFIERLYRSNWGDAGITSLSAGNATEEAFRQQASQHKFLHLATHGFFASERFKSALDRPLGRPELLGRELITSQSISGYHPGLLSGIALAGANQPDPKADDGILTAEEVSGLDLRGVQLVTLSACETGLGRTAGGEGLLGLQRAFQVAGAQTVVASLWEVPDLATRTLMERFYENLWAKDNKLGVLEALREAQLYILNHPESVRGADDQPTGDAHRTSPRYWAAFVLSGDWR